MSAACIGNENLNLKTILYITLPHIISNEKWYTVDIITLGIEFLNSILQVKLIAIITGPKCHLLQRYEMSAEF